MRIEYDKEADAAYIYLVTEIGVGGVAKTVPCDPTAAGEINLDFDSEDRLIGIEVLDASKRLSRSLLGSVN
ncbi:MAG TPA: hypothetical protein DGG94_17485 [Micromonosporaceae bacterium]|nr:hypothetical protein [Micromonosporaceae bacterium]